MASSNHAAYIHGAGQKLVISPAPMYTPSANQVLVKNSAVAMNPADWKMADSGFMIPSFPGILGLDAAGTIVSVGPDVKHLKVGDRVLGCGGALATGMYERATFQEYMIMALPAVCKIPDGMSFEDASVLPLGVATAAAALFLESTLGLKPPPSSEGNGKTLLIWGGSTSVGACGIQLAAASGYEIVATASKHNHEMIKGLGASEVFDYRDQDVVEQVVKGLEGKDVVGAYDCWSTPETIASVMKILNGVSNAKKVIAGVLPSAAALSTDEVKVKGFTASELRNGPLGSVIFEHYLTKALESGNFKAKPDPMVVGHGLESVQLGMDTLKSGVSAKKVVVTL